MYVAPKSMQNSFVFCTLDTVGKLENFWQKKKTIIYIIVTAIVE